MVRREVLGSGDATTLDGVYWWRILATGGGSPRYSIDDGPDVFPVNIEAHQYPEPVKLALSDSVTVEWSNDPDDPFPGGVSAFQAGSPQVQTVAEGNPTQNAVNDGNPKIRKGEALALVFTASFGTWKQALVVVVNGSADARTLRVQVTTDNGGTWVDLATVNLTASSTTVLEVYPGSADVSKALPKEFRVLLDASTDNPAPADSSLWVEAA